MFLHILNGDATRSVFQDSGIEGDVIVWREMLCEGRTPATRNMSRFFEERAAFLQQAYGIDSAAYLSEAQRDKQTLQKAASYDEIVLWFEFDLFCQVNLVFVLYYLSQLSVKLPPVSIVQLDHHPEVPNFRGLGMLQSRHLPPLFGTRTYIQQEDWDLARETWEAYSTDDPLAIEALSHRPGHRLPYLGKALQAHLRRLPNASNGLNAVEHFFLDRLALGKLRERDLYYQFWDELKIYGFGDFQLDVYTNRLQQAGVVKREDEMLSITELGEEVLKQEQNYLSFASSKNVWIGGIPLDQTPWRWDEEEGKVVRP
ncbi:DUF1835 domain-containing protein [Chitinophaga sp. GCM10012297]|uniref:DUF1835 domain-containing protein n=1 Tax=Chitinophaga chungangae TaxID=2821488 RepID=A0ABS3YBW6_9BACT|nr:DUF1835 domain-containing protein [Chitinophaga chungangae]MBO9152182.1 DUF1835 domain-containing protein [Chitinophaga chungangae]